MSENVCRRQFTCRSLGFATSEAEKESFYVSQWGDRRVAFLIYRILVWMYSLGWTLAYLITLGIESYEGLQSSYTFLTNWGDVINTIYFTLAASLAIVGVVNRRKMIFTDSVATAVLRSFAWGFYTAASTGQILITATYWVTLAPLADKDSIATPFNIHRHAVNMFLVFLDFWVAAFPIRLLHFVYATAVAVTYIVMTVIEYATGGKHAIYPFLNWKESPGVAAGVGIGLAIGGPLICQSLWFGLYLLRTFIAKSCSRDIVAEHGPGERAADAYYDIDNPAFNELE